MGELAGPNAEARAYDKCPGAESASLRDHEAPQGIYRCTLVAVLAFSVTVRCLGPWR